MKKRWIKRLSILLAALMISVSVPMTLLAEEQEVFPDNSIAELDEDLNAGEEEIIIEDEGSPVFEEEEELNEGELIVPEDAVSQYTGEDEELGLGEEIFPDDSDSVYDYEDEDEEELGDNFDEADLIPGEDTPEDGEDVPEGEEELNGVPKVSASTSSISVTKGSSKTVKFSYSGTSGRIKLVYAKSNNNVTCSWGSWSGKSIPLTVRANQTGTSRIYVYLKNASTGRNLASCIVKVTLAPNASPKLTASTSSVSLTAGSAQKVTFTKANTTSSVYLKYSTTNTTAYKCAWGKWSGSKLPLTITGKKAGSGTVKVYMKRSSDGATLASVSVKVKVVSKAKLTASAGTVTTNVGSSSQLKMSYSNYSGSVYMSYAKSNNNFNAKWGKWSGSTCPITITGAKQGSGTLYVYLKNASNNATLATVSVAVKVHNNAKVTASASSLTVKNGQTGSVKFTASGVSGSYYFKYGLSTKSYISCSWGSRSGSSMPLNITGKNKGTTTVYVYLYSSANNQQLASTKITVYTTADANPSLKLSSGSLSVKKGNTVNQTVSYSNVSVPVYLQYSTTNTTAYSCSWGGRSGNSMPLTITGKAQGKGTVTVYLKQSSNNATLAKASFTVEVKDSVTLSNLSYSFSNFGEAAPLSVCQYMYGNTSYAKGVYYLSPGAGGNCFGISSTADMFYTAGNGITPNMFNSKKSAVSELVMSDRYSGWNLTVKNFIQCMHVAQYSKAYDPKILSSASQLGNLVSLVNSQMASGKPVMILVYGNYGGRAGHAVLAYGTESVSSTKQRLLIYDNNYPLQTRYLNLYKNSSGAYTGWDFTLTDGVVWGSGKTYSDIGYFDYSGIMSLWNKRGKLTSGFAAYNMLSVNSKNFTVYDVNDAVVATVKNGELITSHDDIVMPVIDNVYFGAQNYHLDTVLFMPIRLYTIKDNESSGGKLRVGLTDVELGTVIETTADKVTLCADDSVDLTTAMLLDAQGEEFEIVLNSSREGEPEEMRWNGVAEDDILSVTLDDGNLEICNVAEDALSVGKTNGGGQTYAISVYETENGSIDCSEMDLVRAGQSRKYTFTPDAGYKVRDVLVDGISQGPVREYTFSNIQANHTLSAEFEKISDKLTATMTASFLADSTGAAITTAPSGTKVRLKAAAAGGSGGYTYKFLIYDNAADAWFKLRDFGAADTCTWTPGATGIKTLFADVKDSSGLVYRYKISGFKVTEKAIALSGTVTASLASDASGRAITTAPSGTKVQVRAEGAGGIGSYTYKFLIYDNGAGTWFKLRDFSSANTYTWTPGVTGTKTLFVDVKDSLGATFRAKLSGFKVTEKAAALSGKVTASLASDTAGRPITTAASGTKVLIRAEGAGGSGGYTYKFLIYDNGAGTWFKLRDFTSTNTYTWTTGAAGTKTLFVDIKDSAGKTVRTKISGFTVTAR